MSKKIKTEIKASHHRCRQRGINPGQQTSQKIINSENLQPILENYKNLTKYFTKITGDIICFLPADALFLLTDQKGLLLKVTGTKKDQQKIKRLNLKPGFSFAEKHSGTNGPALALKTKKTVCLTPGDHFCNFLQDWYCCSEPLIFNNRITGSVSLVLESKKMQQEHQGLLHILKTLLEESPTIKKSTNPSQLNLSSRQLEVLNLLARGFTEKKISSEMNLSLSTIKYHKQKIYKSLEVNCVHRAVLKAVKYKLIFPEQLL